MPRGQASPPLLEGLRKHPVTHVRGAGEFMAVFERLASAVHPERTWHDLSPADLGAIIVHYISFTPTTLLLHAKSDMPKVAPWVTARWGPQVPWSALLSTAFPPQLTRGMKDRIPGSLAYHTAAFRQWWGTVASAGLWEEAFRQIETDAPHTPQLVWLALRTLPLTPAFDRALGAGRTPAAIRLLSLVRLASPGAQVSQDRVWRWLAATRGDLVAEDLAEQIATARRTLDQRLKEDGVMGRLLASSRYDVHTRRRLDLVAGTTTLFSAAWRDRLAAALVELEGAWGLKPGAPRIPSRMADAWEVLLQWQDADPRVSLERLRPLIARDPRQHRLRDFCKHPGLREADALALLDNPGGAAVRAALTGNATLLPTSPTLRQRLRDEGQNMMLWCQLYRYTTTGEEAARLLELIVQSGETGLGWATRLLKEDHRWGPGELPLSAAVLKPMLLSPDRETREVAMRQAGRTDPTGVAAALPPRPARASRRKPSAP